jgi:hypothetical protein
MQEQKQSESKPQVIELDPISLQQVAKTFITELKKKKKEYINYYVQNLPPTFTISSGIVRHDDKIIDIREKEIKNTIPNIDNPIPQTVLSSEEEFSKEKKYYRIPVFHRVKNHQRLTNAFEEAYDKEIKGKRFEDQSSLVYAHERGLEAGIKALHKYGNWVIDNNKMLVEKYPEHFSFTNPNEHQERKEQNEKMKESLTGKLKSWTKSLFSGKGK